MSGQFSQQFIQDFCDYCERFDSLAKSYFNGEQLDELSRKFLDKHENELASKFAYSPLRAIKSNTSELMEGDKRIVLDAACCEDKLHKRLESLPSIQARLALLLEESAANPRLLLADLYRRACHGCYLRITINKSRRKQEDQRIEAVQLGRQAIRLNPSSFHAAHWYLISLGWYLDPLCNPRDRTLVAQLFKEAALWCNKLNPSDPLAHHLLGRYYYNVARLNWLEVTVAKRILGCDFSGTYEDSERELRRAHELASDWLPTGLWMARVLLAQRKPVDEVRQWIEFGLECRSNDPSNELEREELLELRAKLKTKN